ncbi:pyridoxamine 5'-phosphate oxidase family protein [Halobacterium yunchengense]|uniref:pyridoxamine 5'-phosphate oxidase family protein n=1 Tax=Halobacterium yunchengense TaxID=3108497 RepID=UPI003009C9CA
MADSPRTSPDESWPDVSMTDDEAAAFLARAGDGVLTLHGDPPHSFPVSFAYDAETGRCLLQFVCHSASRKRAVLRDDPAATLVAYETTSPDDWASVVVAGALAALDAPDADDRRAYAEQATPIGLSVFDADPADLDVAWYELRPESVSGRRSPV